MNVIKFEKPALKKKAIMKCDGDISPVLNKVEFSKHIFNKYNTSVILGRMGCGKSSLLYDIMTSKDIYSEKFENIYVFMPANSRNDFRDNIFNDLEDEFLYENLDIDSLNAVYDVIQNNKIFNERSLIIFDDVQQALKNNDISKLLLLMIANMRHQHLTMIFLIQNFLAVPPSLRDLASNFFIFPQNERILEILNKQIFGLPNKKFEILKNFAWENSHSWLCYNTKKNMFWNSDFNLIEFKK